MATATQVKSFDHAGTQRTVRHPLTLVRRYIRRYIFLEGAAVTLLFASIVFWVGLGIDYGLYRFEIPIANIWGVDWLMELNDIDTTGGSSLGIRLVLMAALVIGLVVLAFSKVVLRWFREFNDSAVALVLERRFPKELGDRLITAVELADPKLAARYGYSQAMVEKTILECVDRLKSVPVASVFNWRRLTGLWLLVGLTTVGLWLVTMGAFCGAAYIADEPMTPVDYAYEFYDASAIWTERNVLMQNTYWPRRAFLEIGRFQPSKENPNEMRIAKDDANRPELLVRAYEWVIADRDRTAAPHGWRAMTWQDLSAHNLIAADVLGRVRIPAEFEGWQIDPEELEPNLVAALFDTATHERPAVEIRNRFEIPGVKKKIEDRQAGKELEDWLDWKNWKIDKLAMQLDEAKVAAKLYAIDDGASLGALRETLDKLNDLANTRGMSRTLRRLYIPSEVAISFRGEQGTISDTQEIKVANKCTVPLKDLKDSPSFRFRVRGENYFTQPKVIALRAAPTPGKITIDKEEPAYIYHRLRGIDQMALRGQKHITIDMPLSITGDSNTIEVPLGANLVVHVETDRKLREERAVFIKDNSSLPEGFDHYRGALPRIKPDRSGFSLEMTNLTRKHEFSVEFFDEDNIRGKRRFKVLAIIDSEPQMGNLHVFNVNLRKPKFKLAEKKDNDNAPPRDLSELASAFLITPDAVLPFECSVRDEYGLVRVGYTYRYRPVDFDLFSHATKKLPEKKQPEAEPFTRRTGAGVILGVPLLSWAAQRYEQDVLDQQKYIEGYASADGFESLLERMSDRMIPKEAIKASLTLKRTATPWEFDFKNDRTTKNELGFDLQTHLKSLKAVNIEELGQTHYLLKIAVEATDNNVETGAVYTAKEGNETLQLRGNTKRNKNGFINFLVVSENQLLSQIALEEETISEKLEATKDKLDNGLVTLSEQRAKIGDAGVDMDLVLARMNDIRTMIALTGTNLRDAHGAYANIMREMSINRVRQDRKNKIQNNIYDPLDHILFESVIFPGSGSFPNAEDVFHEAFKQVERDVADQQKPNAVIHRQNMDKAEQALVRLAKDLNRVLDAMSEGLVEAKLIAIVARIEEEQRRLAEKLRLDQLKAIKDTLEGLGLGQDKKEPNKEENPKKENDPKKDEKKSSRLHDWRSHDRLANTNQLLETHWTRSLNRDGRPALLRAGRREVPTWIITSENVKVQQWLRL